MSYCRWSGDNYRSNVYCYQSDEGYMIHVAGRRIVGEIPAVDWADQEHRIEQYEAQMAALRQAVRQNIGLPFDGRTFVEPDAAACLARLVALRETGYHVPEYALEALRDEISGE